MNGSTVQQYLLSQAHAFNQVRIRTFDKGAFVYQPGDPQTHIHLIDKGVVKIGSYSTEGERVTYDVLQPGEFFGDLNYLGNGIEFFEFAKALTRLVVVSIDTVYFRHLIIHDPFMSDWFNASVVRRWWKAETRLLHMTRGDIETRLANLRREYSKPVAYGEPKNPDVFSLLSLQDLADLTGTTRQTMSRKLKELAEPVAVY
ncbi:Crp/Fnr family transcriptional regulator [Spirosoma sordidisoli]|uniref:Crp/Fnr family transcriptional regulator n=1 Tax=Spirosoma sordidisoli TaxID=2502893 RepID=A0A4Q2UQP5_9BACT|nr:Crp/Fnr family transcriptional regulator [Spirosoma sordidisoli]RYC69119.1 Crp/Fnr family transcriptional regulator [Spirosoma sordidisoli]